MTQPRAIILGVEHPRALAVMRSLGRMGVPIVAIDHDADARGFYSRFIAQKFLIDHDRESAWALLRELGPRGGGVIIPTNDHYLAVASARHAELSQWFAVTTPPWDVLEPLLYKPTAYALARAVGIETPDWFAPASVEDLDRVIAGLDFEHQAYIIAIADQVSPDMADPSMGRKTRAAPRTLEAFRAACLEIRERTGALPTISQVVPGEARSSIGVSMVADREHEIHAVYVVRRLQMMLYRRDRVFTHPYELGANVSCESCHDDEAVEASRRFVRQAGYYGPLTLEFRREPPTDRLVLIKADPRVVRATALATALDRDVPRALYAAFTGGVPAANAPYPDGVGWMWLTWYVNSLWRNRHISPLTREVGRFVRALPRVRAWAYLDRGDLLPFVTDVYRWAAKWAGIARRWALRQVGLAPPRPPVAREPGPT